jgi:hypothetical protein
MTARTRLAMLPGSAPCERLEVNLVQDGDGRLRIELRQQHYGEGVGWFDQRTIALDGQQWQALQVILGGHRFGSVETEPVTRDVIPFPGPRPADPRRPAVGE